MKVKKTCVHHIGLTSGCIYVVLFSFIFFSIRDGGWVFHAREDIESHNVA